MFTKSKLIFLLVVVSLILLLIPFTAAFTLDVNCPPTVTAGSPVLCTIDLSEDVTDVFGDQFVITAPGFTNGTPFLEPDTNGVSSYNSGGLGATTILLKFSEGQSAGPVATMNLIAGTTAGAYTISLTDYVAATSTTPDYITIVALAGNTSTPDPISDGSGGGGGGSGGSGGGSGSSGSRSSRSTSSGTSVTDIEEEPLEPEQPVEASLPLEESGVTEETSAVSSTKYLWLLLTGMGVLIVVVVGLLVIYLRKRAA
ncbi:MAG: hypothetical protein Q8R37_01620 [Nanoarchaeota archaeon]|nr:hypothetical protein [Nanoarchaeota archaeon]